MENLNKHNDSELLTLMLDGELSPTETEALLQRVSEDPQLMQQLEEMKEIRELVAMDKEELVPPAESKDRVFAAIGIGASAVATGASNSINPAYWFAAASTLVVATLVYLNIMDSTDSIEKIDKNKVKTEQTIENVSEFPIVSSIQKDETSGNTESKIESSNSRVIESEISYDSRNASNLSENASNIQFEEEIDIESSISNSMQDENIADSRNRHLFEIYSSNILSSLNAQQFSNGLLFRNSALSSGAGINRKYILPIRLSTHFAGFENNQGFELQGKLFRLANDLIGFLNIDFDAVIGTSDVFLENPDLENNLQNFIYGGAKLELSGFDIIGVTPFVASSMNFSTVGLFNTNEIGIIAPLYMSSSKLVISFTTNNFFSNYTLATPINQDGLKVGLQYDL